MNRNSHHFILLLLLSIVACKPADLDNDNATQASNEVGDTVITYDSIKAAAYGADAYGMKTYVMAFLKKGPNRDLDSTQAAELQLAHMQNISRMAEEGQLVLAGPFYGDGPIRGIYIFDTPTIAEAEALTSSDPAIQAGSLEMELLQWYGSAALVGLNEVHASLQKQSITETGNN